MAFSFIRCVIHVNVFISFFSAPLHLAVQSRNLNVFSLLLECSDIDLNVRNDQGHSALYYALLGGGPFDGESYASRLVSQGATANPVYPAMGDSLLHLMAREVLCYSSGFSAHGVLSKQF